MQVTEEMREDSEEAYRHTGEVVLRLADAGLENTRLQIAEIFREELNTPGKCSRDERGDVNCH